MTKIFFKITRKGMTHAQDSNIYLKFRKIIRPVKGEEMSQQDKSNSTEVMPTPHHRVHPSTTHGLI